MPDAPRTGRPGRPRDEMAEAKVLRTALDLYGEIGWAAFNFTKVATQAGVGKSTIYSRWENREALLRAAFSALVVCPGPRGDSAREVLMNEADFRLRTYLGSNRRAVRRLFVEASHTGNPTVAQIHNDVFVTSLVAIRDRLWDFKNSGEIPASLSVTRLLDAIEGSVLMRTFCLPDDYIECFLQKVPKYVEDLVSDQLHETPPPLLAVS